MCPPPLLTLSQPHWLIRSNSVWILSFSRDDPCRRIAEPVRASVKYMCYEPSFKTEWEQSTSTLSWITRQKKNGNGQTAQTVPFPPYSAQVWGSFSCGPRSLWPAWRNVTKRKKSQMEHLMIFSFLIGQKSLQSKAERKKRCKFATLVFFDANLNDFTKKSETINSPPRPRRRKTAMRFLSAFLLVIFATCVGEICSYFCSWNVLTCFVSQRDIAIYKFTRSTANLERRRVAAMQRPTARRTATWRLSNGEPTLFYLFTNGASVMFLESFRAWEPCQLTFYLVTVPLFFSSLRRINYADACVAPHENSLPHPFLNDNGIEGVYEDDLKHFKAQYHHYCKKTWIGASSSLRPSILTIIAATFGFAVALAAVFSSWFHMCIFFQ